MNLEEVILRGLASARPLATSVPAGSLYYSSDSKATDRSDGTNWESFSDGGSLIGISGAIGPPGMDGEDGLDSFIGMAGAVSSGSAGRTLISFNQPNSGSGHNPADSTQYFFLTASSSNPGTTSNGNFGPVMTRDGTVTRVFIKVVIGGTLGSNQNVTFTLHNNTQATSEAITTTGQLTANPSSISNTGMTLAFTAGDVLQVSMTTPAWTTNPTGVFYSFGVEYTPT